MSQPRTAVAKRLPAIVLPFPSAEWRRRARGGLDAGASTAGEARRVLPEGAARVIIGTETLRDPRELKRIAAAVDPTPSSGAARGLLSLDLREGVLLGGSPAVRGLDPV